jgi:hypothetical protein
LSAQVDVSPSGRHDGAFQLAISADGKVLVTRGVSTALVWDLEYMMKND